jgi:hypothetical protein
MNRSFSLTSSLSSVIVRALVAASLASVAVGCAADADEESESTVQVAVAADESDPQTREHILLARQVGVPVVEESAPAPTRIDTITASPDAVRCGGGGTCTETASKSCDGFRDSCKSTAGCGTTSTGAGDIAIVSCIAIPTRP